MPLKNKLRNNPFPLISLLLSLALFAAMVAAEETGDVIDAGSFSQKQDISGLPEGWEPLLFKNITAHTSYRLVRDAGVTVIEADSRASSSGLIRRLSVNPLVHPVLSWKWKIANIYNKGDVTRKEGDDYPARIYVTFAYNADKVGSWERIKFNAVKLIYGEYPPINAISYVWASKAPQELITTNPYTDRVRMIVVESGPDKLNQWLSEKRDIAADYRKAFGEDPPHISGIAVMTDSDNTGESAKAWYGDISFSKRHY